MSWGNRLLIVFIAFACLIGYLVYNSIMTKTELVSDDYYQQELKYQDRIQAISNTQKIGDVSVSKNGTELTVVLPKEMDGYKVNGNAWFYCKTDSDKDKHQDFTTSNGTAIFSLQNFPSGSFVLKLSWKAGNEDYYVEKPISL